jgi:dTDP-4-dehydrorhamnose 3,5-epimerase
MGSKIKNFASVAQASEVKGIDGVKIKPLKTYLTEDGYFRELVRDEDNFLESFGQSSISLAHPGFIKAFHYHKKQDDVWYIVSGQIRAVLYDQRPESSTYKQTQVIILGKEDPKVLFIPRGVAHGYQVLGKEDAVLLYHTNHHYDPSDELRIAFDNKEIGFDWSIHNQ